MRFIIYGVGAIGGTVAAALSLSGGEVVGIARGAQLDAIRSGGLLLRTPDKEVRTRFSCVADPAEIDRILARGAERARALAAPVLERTYEIVGLLRG